MMDLQSQVDGLQGRVTSVSSRLQQLKGKLDSAQKAKAAVEEECRKKKINPEKIGELKDKLQKKFDAEKSSLSEKLEKLESELAEYQEA